MFFELFRKVIFWSLLPAWYELFFCAFFHLSRSSLAFIRRSYNYSSSLLCVPPSSNHITNARNTASLQFQPVLQKCRFDQLPDFQISRKLHHQKAEFFLQILIPFMKRLDKNSNFWPFLCDCNFWKSLQCISMGNLDPDSKIKIEKMKKNSHFLKIVRFPPFFFLTLSTFKTQQLYVICATIWPLGGLQFQKMSFSAIKFLNSLCVAVWVTHITVPRLARSLSCQLNLIAQNQSKIHSVANIWSERTSFCFGKYICTPKLELNVPQWTDLDKTLQISGITSRTGFVKFSAKSKLPNPPNRPFLGKIQFNLSKFWTSSNLRTMLTAWSPVINWAIKPAEKGDMKLLSKFWGSDGK